MTIEFYQLTDNETVSTLMLLLLIGRVTIIRDDDAARAGGPAWYAATGNPKTMERAYENDGGKVSAMFVITVNDFSTTDNRKEVHNDRLYDQTN